MRDLVDAIGQPLRVGQVVVFCADDPALGRERFPAHIRDIGTQGAEPMVCLRCARVSDGALINLTAIPEQLVVIGSSVAEVDARVAGHDALRTAEHIAAQAYWNSQGGFVWPTEIYCENIIDPTLHKFTTS